jgi:hypothetical protein
MAQVETKGLSELIFLSNKIKLLVTVNNHPTIFSITI